MRLSTSDEGHAEAQPAPVPSGLLSPTSDGGLDAAGSALTFAEGIPAFPTLRRAALVEVEPGSEFLWLHDLDDAELAFLAVTPWAFFPDYEVVLADEDQAALGLGSADEAVVLCLLTVDRAAGRVTANLRAPVVVSARTRHARQVILEDETLPLQAPVTA